MTTKQFQKLGKAKKAVLVAQDVLERIKKNGVTIEKGYYMDLYLKDEKSYHDVNDLFVKENLDVIDNCKICAMGACMLSTTALGNVLTFKELHNFEENRVALDLLSSVFIPHQLLLIETAFESYFIWDGYLKIDKNFEYTNTYTSRIGHDSFDESLSREEVVACIKFYKRYKTDKNRLIAIMSNLIKNLGTFKP